MNQIRFVCFDFDGVFTNCKFFVTSHGQHFKAYNGKDSYGILLLKQCGIKTALLTAHDTPIVENVRTFNHFNKLDMVLKGSRKKIKVLDAWREELKLTWDEVAYIGDDFSDIECLRHVGFAACPSDAIPTVKAVCDYICDHEGGGGAVREFVEYILDHRVITPIKLKELYPRNYTIEKFVNKSRQTVLDILMGKDPRLLMIVGPCSVHNPDEVIEYAKRLKELAKPYEDSLFLVMRCYLEKPRTTVGWQGFLGDPDLDNSCKMSKGIRLSRKLLLRLNELGVPLAYEFLSPLSHMYLADLISWGCIGSRTTESQPHRQLASSLNFAVGFKNSTSANATIAINAVQVAARSQSFLDINDKGFATIKETEGNPHCHVVLRGGSLNGEPIHNYDKLSIDQATEKLKKNQLPLVVVVDCSHGNSNKNYLNQPHVLDTLLEQIAEGNKVIRGVMLESYILSGHQPLTPEENLKPGISITDSCLSLEQTELQFKKVVDAIRKRKNG